jgi:hypothetical protein
MNNYNLPSPRTKIANFPNSGRPYPIFAWTSDMNSVHAAIVSVSNIFADGPPTLRKILFEPVDWPGIDELVI